MTKNTQKSKMTKKAVAAASGNAPRNNKAGATGSVPNTTPIAQITDHNNLKISVFQDDDGRVHWVSGAAVDADGSNGQNGNAFAYRADGGGLDNNKNAGWPNGDWWNVLIDDGSGHPHGQPMSDGNGNWYSSTAYVWAGRPLATRYVDATTVPYVVVNPTVRMKAQGVVLGCKARVSYNGASIDAVVADVSGPSDIGELSIAAAQALGFSDTSPRTGGVNTGVTFEFWPDQTIALQGDNYNLIPAGVGAIFIPKVVDHSAMKLGKRMARHDSRVPMLSKYTATLPTPPAQVDYQSKVLSWPMMLNDKLGDCTCAALGHIIQQWTSYNNQPVVLTDQQVEDIYEIVGGYNPDNPSTDQGAVEVDVLNYWLNTGAFGHKLDGYASLELQNHDQVMDAVYWFGNCYIGLGLPISAQTQPVWTVPPGGATGQGAPGSWGGHAVPVVAYDARGLIVVTWGALKRMTWQFWDTYCDEAYALLSNDWMTNSIAPQGIDSSQLNGDMAEIKQGFASAAAIKHI